MDVTSTATPVTFVPIDTVTADNKFNIVAVSLFSCSCIFLFYQIVQVLVNKHRILSFMGGFTSLSIIWCLLRISFFSQFFLGPNKWPLILARFLYWLPINFEFMTFSLLIVFFASVVYAQRFSAGGHQKMKWVKIGWALINFSLLAINIVWLIIVGNDVEVGHVYWKIKTIVNGSVFFLLSIMIAYFGYRMLEVVSAAEEFMPLKLPQGVTLLQLKVSIVLLFVVFASRCLYDWIGDLALSTSAHFGVRNATLDGKSLAQLLCWEWFPMLLIIAIFRHIPKRKGYQPVSRTDYPTRMDPPIGSPGSFMVQLTGDD